MRGPTPDTTPTCQSCGYSLDGLRELRCPECNTSYEPPYVPPPLPPLTFLTPVARLHAVCAFNAIACILAMLFGIGGGRHGYSHVPTFVNWGWDDGGAAAAFLNLLLAFALLAIFPRRSDGLQIFLTMTLCVVSLFIAAGASARIV